MPQNLTPDETLQYLAVFLNEWIPAKRVELEALQAKWERTKDKEAKPDRAAPPAQSFLAMAFGSQADQPVQPLADLNQKSSPSIGANAPLQEIAITDDLSTGKTAYEESKEVDALAPDDAPPDDVTPAPNPVVDEDENLV